MEGDGFGREQGGSHTRQGGIFGAANRHPPAKRPATCDAKLVHEPQIIQIRVICGSCG